MAAARGGGGLVAGGGAAGLVALAGLAALSAGGAGFLSFAGLRGGAVSVGLRLGGGAAFGPFYAAAARFGPPLGAGGLEGALVVAEPLDACSQLGPPALPPAQVRGEWIALIQRSPVVPFDEAGRRCTFVQKVLSAEAAGASAVIIFDSVPEPVIAMGHAGGGFAEPGIPSVFVGMDDGDMLKNVVLHGAWELRPSAVLLPGAGAFSPLGLAVCGSFGILLTVIVMGSFLFRQQPLEARYSVPIGARATFPPLPARPRGLASEDLRRLPVAKYRDLQALHGSGEATCSICLEEFGSDAQLKVLPCGHWYHTQCIDKWLVGHVDCPLCKRDVRQSLEGAPSDQTPLLQVDAADSPVSAHESPTAEESTREGGDFLIDIGSDAGSVSSGE